MLLDLWEWFLLISDGIDLVISNLASGTYPIPLSFILASFFFVLISFFAWRSTDIPDLPPAPRPPYVIQITAGPNGSLTSRQTISDVRLLSSGVFFDRSEILGGYHQNISRNQATNTDRPGIVRNAAGGRQVDSSGPVLRGRSSAGRSFLFGLFRRPNAFARPVPAPTLNVNAIRTQLGAPNAVVYHRVNVYHHHIHSHVGSNPNPNSGNNSSTGGASSSSANQFPSNPSQTQGSNSNSNPSSSSSTTTDSVPDNGQTTSSSQQNLTESELISGPVPQSSSTTVTSLSDESNGSRGPEATFSDINNLFGTSTAPSSSEPVVQTSSFVNEGSMPASSGDQSEGSGSGSNRQQPFPQRHGGDGSGGGDGDDDVHFTIKFLNDSQMDVTSQLSEKVVDFKRRHFATEMSENKTVRLIFNGRVLDNDNKTLREMGIFEQCVVHCLIVNRQQSQDQSRSGSGGGAGIPGPGGGLGLDGGGARVNVDAQGGAGNLRRGVFLPEPGMFFVAFIGIFLVFLWFICLHFGQHLFTQSAVVSLTVLTAIFLIGIVACYLPLPAN